MPETYERDGIVYFKEPYKTDMTEWVGNYLDCDALVDNLDFSDNTMVIYAYSKDYTKLKEIKIGNCHLLRGFSSQEVNCID